MLQRLILVGAGHAHLSVLALLARRRPSNLSVELVTTTARATYSGMLPGWMAGHYRLDQCQIDVRPLAQAAGVKLRLGQLAVMEAARQCISLNDGRRLDYDWLSLDTGSETDTSWLTALGDALLPVKPLEPFIHAWPKLLMQARSRGQFRLVVVGAGAAGVEMALAARHAFLGVGVQTPVALVASESGLLPGHAPEVQQRMLRVMRDAGVELYFQRAAGTPQGVLLSDGRLLEADTVLAATGARAPVWPALSGLALDDKAYVAVDAHHRSVSHHNVFAAGDVCARSDQPVARSGVHAVHAGPVLAHNLLAVAAGSSHLLTYLPRPKSLYLLSCGTRYAVASWGNWSIQGTSVWCWKDWIDRRFIRRFSRPQWSSVQNLQERSS